MSTVMDSALFEAFSRLVTDLQLTVPQALEVMERVGSKHVPSAIDLAMALLGTCQDILYDEGSQSPLDPDLTAEMAKEWEKLSLTLPANSDQEVTVRMAQDALAMVKFETINGTMPVMFSGSRHQFDFSEFGDIVTIRSVVAGADAILAVIPLGALPRLKA